ncbi:MAG: ribonuclease HII [Candidatus Heimdallarchaeota archaeon]
MQSKCTNYQKVKEISEKKKYIVGIDEAGRGPVIGPLVICAYAIEKNQEEVLRKLGVKDSKILSKKKREELYPKLKSISVDYKIKHISPAEIDELRKSYSLNIIEQKIMLKLTKEFDFRPDEIYIDAADVKEKRFGEVFEKEFNKAKVVSKHQADKVYPVVSAASILAKVERDTFIEKLASKIGEDIGSGYPADPKTKAFLRSYYSKNKKFPPYVRDSWDTVKNIKKEFSNSKLSDFFGSD